MADLAVRNYRRDRGRRPRTSLGPSGREARWQMGGGMRCHGRQEQACRAWAGCDKRIETCGAKLANKSNFRGLPHIPGQDAVLRCATKDGGHDGGVL